MPFTRPLTSETSLPSLTNGVPITLRPGLCILLKALVPIVKTFIPILMFLFSRFWLINFAHVARHLPHFRLTAQFTRELCPYWLATMHTSIVTIAEASHVYYRAVVKV